MNPFSLLYILYCAKLCSQASIYFIWLVDSSSGTIASIAAVVAVLQCFRSSTSSFMFSLPSHSPIQVSLYTYASGRCPFLTSCLLLMSSLSPARNSVVPAYARWRAAGSSICVGYRIRPPRPPHLSFSAENQSLARYSHSRCRARTPEAIRRAPPVNDTSEYGR